MRKSTIAAMPKYETYKNSGVDWLGDIPTSWGVRRLKYLFNEINKRSLDGSENLLSVSQYTGVNLKSAKISEGDLLTNAESLEGYKVVTKNDLVSNIMLAWNGSLGFSAFDGIVSPAYAVYRLLGQNQPRFFHYLLRTEPYKAEYKRKSTGVIESRLRLYSDEFFNVLSLLPSAEEQLLIAQYLDQKTVQVDEAIAIKEQQITLLRERKQIIIQKAVTQGLDPNAPMKDSGVDCIGEIPEHWALMSLRYAFTFLNNRRVPLSAVERETMQGDYPYYGASGIIDFVNQYIFDEDLLLIAEDGANLLSKSTPLAFVATGKYWVNNHAHIIKPRFEGFKYWAELLSCLDYTIFISGAAQPKLTRDNLASVRIPVPPSEEIKRIIDFINSIEPSLDKAINIQHDQIEKLKEYKTTLINSAVTGKIKITPEMISSYPKRSYV